MSRRELVTPRRGVSFSDVKNRWKKIAIVGSGALGCYYGAMLQRAGAQVVFLMRSDRDVVSEKGLRVMTPSGNFSLPAVNVAGSSEEIGVCDLVIVALKTTANAEFLKLVGPLLHEDTAILTLQNGLGSDEELAALFGAKRVMGGLCFICVNRTAPGEILCITPGSISLGEFGCPITERLTAVSELFAQAGVKTRMDDDLAGLRWKKLVWNVPFNGLAIAAGGITTENILAQPVLEAEVRALMKEIIEAAAKIGHVIPLSSIEEQIEHTRPMGPYQPSSLIDYRENRPVEVEAIWGEPLRRAREVGAVVPKLELLYALLVRLTKR